MIHAEAATLSEYRFYQALIVTRSKLPELLEKNIGCLIIWGGKHPTADPEDSILQADMVGISEGEDTLVEVVDNLSSGKSCDNVPGLWIKQGNEIIKNPLRPLETNLDRFLFPDYSLENKFLLDREVMRIGPVEDRDLDKMRKLYPTMITRGCLYCCTFCTNSTNPRLRRVRFRSVDNVI